MHGILTQLGKDSVMYMSPDEFPLPWEYRGLPLDQGVVMTPPADVAERTIVFLDCGNIDRMPVDFLQADGLHILNIDHHHDNTRFGTVNLVCSSASCTAEIVWRLSKELGAEITPEIAKALYVGLVTDTGRFMYENTSPDAHRMAAELIEVGVEPHRVYRRALRGPAVPAAAAASARAGFAWSATTTALLTVAHLTKPRLRADRRARDRLRGSRGPHACRGGNARGRLVRELLSDDREGMRKVSLRATDGTWTSRAWRARSAAAGIRRPRASRPRCRIPSWSTSSAPASASSSSRS